MKDCPPPSPTVFRCFPLFSAVFRRPPPSPTVPYQNMSQIVGLVVLPNDGRPGNSRTRTDYVLPSGPVPGSWQSPRRALRGPGRLRTLQKRAHKHTKQEKPTQQEKPPSGSHDPKPVVPQTTYHTLTTMGFQLSLGLSVLPAASYIYTKAPEQKNPHSHHRLIFFNTTPTTFQHTASLNPLTRFQLLTEFFLAQHS